MTRINFSTSSAWASRRPAHLALALAALLPMAACGQVTSGPDGRGQAATQGQGSSEAEAIRAQAHADEQAARGEPALEGDPDSTSTLFEGLLDCSPKGWYIDAESGRPANPYLARNAPQPCERDAEFGIAYFCVNADFHGVPVYRVVAHLGTAPTPIGVLIDLPLDQARSRLQKALGTELGGGPDGQQGRKPVLGPHGDDTQKSQLMCTPDWA
ncbi:MAG: hypothetical protein ACN6RJ_03675 [Stenotrophomonas sp.]